MPRILLILCIAAVPAAAQTFEWATFGPAGGAAIVAVDPQNPRVLYAAGNGSGLNLFSGSPLFKSTDGGSNWTLTGLKGDVPPNIRQIEVDPHRTDHIYVTTVANGVFRSLDGGASWSRLSTKD